MKDFLVSQTKETSMEMKEISFGLYSEALCSYPILHANKSLLFANKIIFAGGLHGAIAGFAPL